MLRDCATGGPGKRTGDARMSRVDMYTFGRKVAFYEKRHGRTATRKLVISLMAEEHVPPGCGATLTRRSGAICRLRCWRSLLPLPYLGRQLAYIRDDPNPASV